jgi:hypothetical protein
MSNQDFEKFSRIFYYSNGDTISKENKQALLDTAFNNKTANNHWYSKQLSAMKEPVIYSDTTQTEIIRFTWLRSFHDPIAVRIEKDKGICTIYWKKRNEVEGNRSKKIVINSKKMIELQQWNDIEKRLEKINFWVIPTNLGGFDGYDGARWILEAKVGNKYHFVDRWSGDESEMEQFCLTLLNMTNLKIEKKEIY